MSDAVKLEPFPSLSWDGLFWRTPLTIPWYPSAGRPELVVRPDYSRSCEPTSEETAPRPTDTQAAAFRLIVDPDSPLPRSLLPPFRRFVPELAGAEWGGVPAFFELATVLIYHASSDDVSYTGFVFNCLHRDYGYEHGIGIVAHGERVVHFGMAEEATDEAQCLKDLRAIARVRRGKPAPPGAAADGGAGFGSGTP